MILLSRTWRVLETVYARAHVDIYTMFVSFKQRSLHYASLFFFLSNSMSRLLNKAADSTASRTLFLDFALFVFLYLFSEGGPGLRFLRFCSTSFCCTDPHMHNSAGTFKHKITKIHPEIKENNQIMLEYFS